MIRKPVVSGMFYPQSEEELYSSVDDYLTREDNPVNVKGIVSPHAGYIYSGKTAGLTFGKINVPDRVIILSPNHTGIGEVVSVMSEGKWEIPGGSINIDSVLSNEIIKMSSIAKNDHLAHLREHSIEVQLPFIKKLNKEAEFVPITIATQQYDLLEDLAESISKSIAEYEKEVLIVASSDMSHYISQSEAETMDHMAIDRILSSDPKGLLDTVTENSISMCGVSPVVVMLAALNSMGKFTPELVNYSTSAEVSGDLDHVVGYAGIIIK